MSESNSKSKPILIVLATLIIIGLVFFLLNKEQMFATDIGGNKVELGATSNQNYQIVVYYFPEKKAEAKALAYYFKEHDYNISMQPAASEPALKGSKNSPSHLFFNRSDINTAMQIKSLIEEVIGKPVNAYRFHEYQTDPAMMMVFTEH